MPIKKPIKKTVVVTKKPVVVTKKAVVIIKKPVSAVEMKAKDFAKNFEKEANVIKTEGKEIGSKIGARREESTNEEKIFTILGIILLILGLYVLRNMIGGMLLIVLGILFVTGFFLKRKK